jgi:hypothetical protein
VGFETIHMAGHFKTHKGKDKWKWANPITNFYVKWHTAKKIKKRALLILIKSANASSHYPQSLQKKRWFSPTLSIPILRNRLFRIYHAKHRIL